MKMKRSLVNFLGILNAVIKVLLKCLRICVMMAEIQTKLPKDGDQKDALLWRANIKKMLFFKATLL